MKIKLLLFCAFCAIIISGCKTSEKVTSSSKVPKVSIKTLEKRITPRNNYDWFSAKIKMNYQDAKYNQSFSANLRYKKDSIIWISLTGFLGIEGGRVLITPDSVRIIDRLNKKYYQYPISYLESYIPFPLSISELQSVFVGDRFYEHQTKPRLRMEDDLYLLTANDKIVESNYLIHPKNYTMAEMRLKDKLYNRQLLYKFDQYKKFENRLFAFFRDLEFKSASNNIKVEMTFTKIKVNEPQQFPFQVPERFERIN